MLNIFAVQWVYPLVYTDVANANQPQRATCFEIKLLLISSAVYPEFHQLSGEKFIIMVLLPDCHDINMYGITSKKRNYLIWLWIFSKSTNYLT